MPILVGSVIASTANTIAQLVVARVILGAGISVMTVAAPAYAIEIAPAHWRGKTLPLHTLVFRQRPLIWLSHHMQVGALVSSPLEARRFSFTSG